MTLASRKRRSVGTLLVVETEVLRQRYELVERSGLFRFGERLVGEYVGEFEAAVATQANGGEVTVVDERNDSGSTDAKNFCGLAGTQHVGYGGDVHRSTGRKRAKNISDSGDDFGGQHCVAGGCSQSDLLAFADGIFDEVERVGLFGWHSDLGDAHVSTIPLKRKKRRAVFGVRSWLVEKVTQMLLRFSGRRLCR
jgi:hypothetical protein